MDTVLAARKLNKLELPLSILKQWNQQFSEYLWAEPLFFRPRILCSGSAKHWSDLSLI